MILIAVRQVLVIISYDEYDTVVYLSLMACSFTIIIAVVALSNIIAVIKLLKSREDRIEQRVRENRRDTYIRYIREVRQGSHRDNSIKCVLPSRCSNRAVSFCLPPCTRELVAYLEPFSDNLLGHF
jgi:hypothetical protein